MHGSLLLHSRPVSAPAIRQGVVCIIPRSFAKRAAGGSAAAAVAIERVERLEEEKKAIGDDIRDVYAEAKANGFDVKALRSIVRLRKQDADERREQEAILETYMHALGMVN
jgi:uncharacterized protein (UPF0335 family)